LRALPVLRGVPTLGRNSACPSNQGNTLFLDEDNKADGAGEKTGMRKFQDETMDVATFCACIMRARIMDASTTGTTLTKILQLNSPILKVQNSTSSIQNYPKNLWTDASIPDVEIPQIQNFFKYPGRAISRVNRISTYKNQLSILQSTIYRTNVVYLHKQNDNM
jgi:hypothetical protein